MLSWCHPGSDYPFNPSGAINAVQVSRVIPLPGYGLFPVGICLHILSSITGDIPKRYYFPASARMTGFVSSSQVHSTTTLVPVLIIPSSLEPGGVVYSSCSSLSNIHLCCEEYTWGACDVSRAKLSQDEAHIEPWSHEHLHGGCGRYIITRWIASSAISTIE